MLDFLGIGAQKAGTTWLCERLSTHPQIRFPGGKEMHFWNHVGDPGRSRGLKWYRGVFAANPPGVRQGEITPAYAILPPATIAEIRRNYPELRLLYVIRNPIERAWSAALMWLDKMEMRIEEASDAWFLDQFRSQASLRRGDYARCLQAWAAEFPAERILVIRYEELAAAPRDTLLGVCAHLEVDAGPFAAADPTELGARVFAGTGHALPERLREELRRLYAEPIERLRELLGDDLAAWR
ncbi:MAG: hypothetical protein RL398_2860 [Planctomycetota bacterium]|jgi:hypothetical protein